MPKKKGNKGKGKGKAKKEGKDSKSDKESEVEKFKSNAALWEAKLTVTEISRLEYREATRSLAKANEELENQQYRAEKDTRDIIAFLKRIDREKTARIFALEEQVKLEKAKSSEEKDKLVSQYMERMEALEEKFKQRASDFQRMPEELKTIKHFRQIKASLEADLIKIRENIAMADRSHQESLTRAECKFYMSRIHLEKEAEQKISQLSEEAHHEAVVQLGTVSQTVFRENIRLNEALNYQVKQAEELKRMYEVLAEKNGSLSHLKETNELMRKEADSQLKAKQHEISELTAKLASLEQALEVTSRESRKGREEMELHAALHLKQNCTELDNLEMLLAAREKELNHVKRLAQSIIDQRRELELFFHEALDHVRKQIKVKQQNLRQESMKAYRWRMNEAHAGRCEFPPIQTFLNAPHSTKDVQNDQEEDEKWNKQKNVDISDLSWKQKESLLNLLFAKLNGHKIRKQATPSGFTAPSSEMISSDAEFTQENHSLTFLTQMPMESMTYDPCSLPPLKST